MSKKKRHFVVERLNWQEYTSIGSYQPNARAKRKKGARALLPGSQRVSCFDDAAEADTDCRRRESEARTGVNPFACGMAFCYLTSLDEGRLGDWVQDYGLTPPEQPGLEAWRDWWDVVEPTLNELQRVKVWEALDKVRFFRVAEVPRRVLFVVAGAYWNYNDEYYYRHEDGLTPYSAYKTREEAEAERLESEDIARDTMDLSPFEMNGLCNWSEWSSLPEEEAVARVEALGLPAPAQSHRKTRDWEEWWNAHQDLDYEQEEAVWNLLDKIRFYDVVEVEFPE